MTNVIGIAGFVSTVMLRVSNAGSPNWSPLESRIVTGTARAAAGKNMSIAKTIRIFFTLVSSFKLSSNRNLLLI
jgi:hypothetical protein